MYKKFTRPIRQSILFGGMLLFIALAVGNQAYAQSNINVAVKVFETDGATPVIGAKVALVGNIQKVALTDVNGEATLNSVPSDGAITVSFLGFVPQEKKIDNRKELIFTLDVDAIGVEEVIVVGYGTQKKASLTGSVANINMKQMDTRPLQSVSQAIQGQVPGVVAVQQSGQPGSQTASVTVRGKNSINDGGPLVIIDGVPGNMNTIDPNDVESLSILKDAASAAIYGVQAASGVILITTKKGKLNKAASVNYNGNVSFATPTDIPRYTNSYDYATLYNEAQLNDNSASTPRFSADDLRKFQDGSSPYTHADTDWYNATFKKWTTETQHAINISGGSANTVYNASAGILYQDGKVENNNYRRYNARFNTETQITNWFKVGMNLSGYTSMNNQGWDGPTSLVQYANRLAPIYPIYSEDGSYFGGGYQNPLAQAEYSGWRKYQQTEWTATGYFQVNFLPSLSFKGLYSFRDYTGHDTGFKRAYKYGAQNNAIREGYDNNSRTGRETIQALLNFNETFGKHTVAALAGYEQYLLQYRWVNASRSKGGSNNLDESLNTLDPSTQQNSSSGYDVARMSAFARLQYNFDNKYFIEGNFRADASSRFAPENRWGFFPSVSGAWRITEEEFMKGSSHWLSNLKIRAGYGVTGNEEISGNYEWQTTYGIDKYQFDNSAYQIFNEARYANAIVTWANVTNIEGAIEASFLDNKVGFEVAVYEKTTDGMLLQLPLPAVLGAKPPTQNAGIVKNTGVDFSAFFNGRSGDFTYNVTGNFGYVKNQLVDIKGNDGENPNDNKQWYITGQPIGTYYGYIANGMFRTEEDLKNYPKRTSSDKLGNLRYEDLDGDGKITAKDRGVMGYTFPKFTAGLSLSATWKSLEFNCLFQGAFGASTYLEGEASYAFYNGGKALDRHLDRWSPQNPDGAFPRMTLNAGSNDYVTNSYWLADASYVRLKNATISYNLPKAWMTAIKLSSIRVYVSGENLFTIKSKDMAGLDPESPSGRGAMYSNVLKTTIGLRVTF